MTNIDNIGKSCPYDIIIHVIRTFLLPNTTQCCQEYPLHSILFLDKELYYNMLRYLPPKECLSQCYLDLQHSQHDSHTNRQRVKLIRKNVSPHYCSFHQPMEYHVLSYVYEHSRELLDIKHQFKKILNSHLSFNEGGNPNSIKYSLIYHPFDNIKLLNAWKNHTDSPHLISRDSSLQERQQLLECIQKIVVNHTYYYFSHYCCSHRGVNFKIKVTNPYYQAPQSPDWI